MDDSSREALEYAQRTLAQLHSELAEEVARVQARSLKALLGIFRDDAMSAYQHIEEVLMKNDNSPTQPELWGKSDFQLYKTSTK